MISPLPLIRASFNNRKPTSVASVDKLEAPRTWSKPSSTWLIISMMDFLVAHSAPNAQLPLNIRLVSRHISYYHYQAMIAQQSPAVKCLVAISQCLATIAFRNILAPHYDPAVEVYAIGGMLREADLSQG
jgi:hypothetical protein